MAGPVAAYVALGANLGDRLASLRRAASLISQTPGLKLEAAASLYESAAVGTPAPQPAFLNSVLRVSSTLAPDELMAALLDIECAMGRKREERLAPRVIDLDLLLYGELVLDSAELTLPHPRLHERRFVLEPLAELAAELVHPRLERSFAELKSELATSGQELCRVMGPQWADQTPMQPG